MFDPRMMKRLLQQSGIETKTINASKVIIESDEGSIILEGVEIIQMEGKKLPKTMFYITAEKIEKFPFNEDDIKFVMENANVNKETAITLLKESKGDVAEALEKAESLKEG